VIREFVIRFDADDMIAEIKMDADFVVIARQPNECECQVDVCAEQIERMQLVAEVEYGGWLPWTYFPDDDNLICRSGPVN
jgi:hypothetical protein